MIYFLLLRHRVPISDDSSTADDIINPEYDTEGQSFVEFTGQRKSSVATVKVMKPGSGRFIIKHVDYIDTESDITYFFE